MVWILAVAVAYVVWAVAAVRRLVQLRQQVEEAWSGIEVQLDRRSALVPRLVTTVKASQAHESGVLQEVASLLRSRVRREAQPHLQSGPASADLMHQLERIEDDLQGARMLYNQAVQRYNERVTTLPALLVARAMGLRTATYFEAPDLRVS